MKRRTRVNKVKRVIASIMMLAMLVGVLSVCSYIESTYTMYGTVTEVDGDDEYIVDSMGEEWIVVGEGLRENEVVKIKFNNNHTDSTRIDDTILKVTVK